MSTLFHINHVISNNFQSMILKTFYLKKYSRFIVFNDISKWIVLAHMGLRGWTLQFLSIRIHKNNGDNKQRRVQTYKLCNRYIFTDNINLHLESHQKDV